VVIDDIGFFAEVVTASALSTCDFAVLVVHAPSSAIARNSTSTLVDVRGIMLSLSLTYLQPRLFFRTQVSAL
jgi:hypothetical protein